MRFKLATALVGFGLMVQVAVLGIRGPDVGEFETWSRWFVEHGILGAYRAPLDFQIVDGRPQGMDERPTYPPLSLALLAVSGHVNRQFDPAMTDSPRFRALIKAPIILASGAFLLLVLTWYRRQPSRVPQWSAAAIVAAFWLNPALVVSGPIHGYLEALYWAPGAAALVLASSGRTVWPGVLIAISVLMKPQGLFLALPLATILWNQPRREVTAGLAAALTIGAVIAPFAVTGNAPALFHEVFANATAGDQLLSQATNAWWLVTEAIATGTPTRWIPIAQVRELIGFDPYRPAAALVMLTALGLVWRVRRTSDLAVHCAMAALVVHVYFTFAVGVHENHLDAVVPLVGLTVLGSSSNWRLFWAMSALVLVNQTAFYGLGEDFNPPWMRTWFVIDAPLLVAVVNFGLLGWHTRNFLRMTKS